MGATLTPRRPQPPRMQERAKRRGEKQRVHSGDSVEDDVLGVGKIEKIDGGLMTIIFGSGDTMEVSRCVTAVTAVPTVSESGVRTGVSIAAERGVRTCQQLLEKVLVQCVLTVCQR